MITTDGEFIFVKLVRDELSNKYATSDLFILRRRHEN
jgi:hypothetical protein